MNGTSTNPSPHWVQIFADVTGGNGGDSVSGNGGAGASVTLINAISASIDPNGSISLAQNATAGSGGATGGNGQAGMAGTADSEFTISRSAASLEVVTMATGGDGGGLAPSIGGPVLNAQIGGMATANVDVTNPAQNGAVVAGAGATGGDGGFGFGPANGGTGGAAEASATGAGVGPDSLFLGVNVSASAVGGNGGMADGIGTTPGSTSGGTGGTATATASGSSAYILHLSVGAVGGSGGDGENGANGGRGADVDLVNPVNGSTSGEFDLGFGAVGGGGGNALDSGAAGLAGNANAVLSMNQASSTIQSTQITAMVVAQGGFGGNGTMQDGAAGGSAHTAIKLNRRQRERGGDRLPLLAAAAGLDFPARAAMEARPLRPRPQSVSSGSNGYVFANGGAGGEGTVRGGDGASVSLVNAVSGSSPSGLELTQEAQAGDGGLAQPGGIGGNGGNAVSNLTAVNPAPGSFSASARAYGGRGGFSEDMDGNILSAQEVPPWQTWISPRS